MDRFAVLAEAPAQASFRLPISRTPIIGREAVRASLAEPIRRSERLITLVGAGGVGKTRLALAVAEDVRPDFEGRVGWVSLGELSEPDLLLDAIARSLEITIQSRDPLDALSTALGDRPALLVIDNMEHLAGGAIMLGALLERVPALSLLVTSRVPLRLIGEREVRITPFPAIGASGAELADHPAVRLFTERARAVDSTFEPDRAALERIAAIVEQLDYLPLAIELAAARVRHFPLEEIQQLLSSSLDLLTGGPRDAPDRHRTIRGAIGWSYTLLSPEEQRLFRWLSVFPGPFTLESAIQLFGGNGSTRVETIDLVSNLVDQNLLIRSSEPGAGRYVMLGSIREYGQTQLAGADEEHAVRARFAEIVIERVTPSDDFSSDNVVWLETVEQSMDDVRSTFSWLIGEMDGQRALQLAERLSGWWTSRGVPREGVRYFQSAFAIAQQVPDTLRIAALRDYAWLQALTGAISDALSHRDDIESLARALDTPLVWVKTEQLMGALAFVEGDFEEGKRRTQHAIELAEQGDIMSQFRGLLFNMATLSEILGDYDAALDYHRRGIALMERSKSPGFYAMHLVGMGNLALRMGDPPEADRLVIDAWPELVKQRDAQNVASALLIKSEVLLEAGWPLPAADLFGAADELIDTHGRVLTEIELVELDRLHAKFAQALGPDEFERARNAGRTRSLEELTPVMMEPVEVPSEHTPPEPSLLTPRETEVARLLVEGKTNPEIAADLFISERTVQSHVANIMTKLGVNSRTAAAARVVRDDLLPA
jgi:non-specific serine/threonine protein kinase